MKYWVSCNRFTVRVTVVDGRITDAAPVLRRFIGQPFDNLLAWARRLGGMRMEVLPEREPTFEERYGPWICMGCGRPHKLGGPCPQVRHG